RRRDRRGRAYRRAFGAWCVEGNSARGTNRGRASRAPRRRLDCTHGSEARCARGLGVAHCTARVAARDAIRGSRHMNNDLFRSALERLSRVAGVRGALIVDTDAGVPVVAELSADVDGTALAALAASLFKRTDRAVQTAAYGKLSTLQLVAE